MKEQTTTASTVRVQFLGTGGAEGVPVVQCECDHCRRARQEGGRLRRRRSAVYLRLPHYNLLVGAPPEVREYVHNYRITELQGVVALNNEFAHIGGIKEFEYWQPASLDFLSVPALFRQIRREYWTERLRRVFYVLPLYPNTPMYLGPEFQIWAMTLSSQPATFGLVVQMDRRKIAFLGQAPIERLPRLALQHLRGAQAVVVGLPVQTPAGDISQRLQNLHRWGQDLNVSQVVLSHVGHQAPPHDALEALAAEVAPSVHIAYDGWELAL